MKDSEIHIGDRLRIREWDDMAAEFETDDDGDLEIYDAHRNRVWFTREMQYLCGQTFTVREIVEDSVVWSYVSEEPDPTDWTIIAPMLEPAGDPEPVSAPEDSGGLFSFLLSQ